MSHPHCHLLSSSLKGTADQTMAFLFFLCEGTQNGHTLPFLGSVSIIKRNSGNDKIYIKKWLYKIDRRKMNIEIMPSGPSIVSRSTFSR